MKEQTVLVTGASSGIGEATARALQAAGYAVYAGARRVDRMQHLADLGIHVVSLDVTDDASMTAAIALIEKEAGGVDILINNAGYGSYGALEEVPMAEARRQLDVNVFGMARLSQLVIPGMRAAHQGTVINISSIGGKFGEAFGAWYHAAKFAVEGLSDSLALELAPFGIHVIAVEPGGIKTDWSTIAADNLEASSAKGPYAAEAVSKVKVMRNYNASSFTAPPEVVANGIVKILRKSHPKLRYAVGGGAGPLMFFRKYAGDRLFYWFVKRFVG